MFPVNSVWKESSAHHVTSEVWGPSFPKGHIQSRVNAAAIGYVHYHRLWEIVKLENAKSVGFWQFHRESRALFVRGRRGKTHIWLRLLCASQL